MSSACDSLTPSFSAYTLFAGLPSNFDMILLTTSDSETITDFPVGLNISSCLMSKTHRVFTKRKAAPSCVDFPLHETNVRGSLPVNPAVPPARGKLSFPIIE